MGDLVPVHDPSMIRAQDGDRLGWYVFTTDLPFEHAAGFLQVRCSEDGQVWRRCGHVFDEVPGWVRRELPGAVGLWAPEISYFGGVYHLYYAASTLGSQHSVIGLATNATLDPKAPGDRWVDQGEVLGSKSGDNYNAIDPSITIDGDPERPRSAWITYGSYWSGIKQRRLDPATGKLDASDGQVYALAARPRDHAHAIEGASLIEHGGIEHGGIEHGGIKDDGWYYLFASVGLCCEIPIERDTYREIVGRSRSVHGPFVGQDGSKMLRGGGTVLLESNGQWLAPGGGSAYTDPRTGETWLAFHALRRSENGALYLWIKRVEWRDGWPVLM
jgi:arabinan endo-1,5-alpha-L-arabinosidase